MRQAEMRDALDTTCCIRLRASRECKKLESEKRVRRDPATNVVGLYWKFRVDRLIDSVPFRPTVQVIKIIQAPRLSIILDQFLTDHFFAEMLVTRFRNKIVNGSGISRIEENLNWLNFQSLDNVR